MAASEEQFEDDELLSYKQFEYDVFLSYNRRERDADSFFPQHLHDVLNQNGIKCYKYSEDLEVGEEIAPAVVEAIEASRISIVILSRSYASSASCLSELVKILEQANLIGKRVMPLFYRVEPSCVRRQRESYHEAMAENERRYGSSSDKVIRWREALAEIGDLSGWILALNQGEAEFTKGVAGDIGITLRQLKAPIPPEASPKYFLSLWATVLGYSTVGAFMICLPSILLLLYAERLGIRKDEPLVILFVAFNVCQYLLIGAAILRSKIRQNTA